MKKLLTLGALCLLFTISVFSQTKKEWDKVQSLNSWNVYQQFILNYPNGKYTEEAKKKLALLEPPAPVNKVEEKKVVTEVPVEKSRVITAFDSSKYSGPIILKKKRYYVNDKQLTNKELKSLLVNNPASVDEYNKAKKNATIAMVPMSIGVGLVLYGTIVELSSSADEANSISNGETVNQSKWVVPILAGATLVAVGLPFIITSNSHAKKAINNYNAKRTTGYNEYPKLELGITQNGLKVIYRF